MILQSLVNYYESMAAKGLAPRPGWCQAKVSFALDISDEGELLGVIPLQQEVQRGKKTAWVPQTMTVPEMVKRAGDNIVANFLCDNSSYLLGIDLKGKPKRSQACFECARQRHEDILQDVHTPAARAVKRFFQRWQPEAAVAHSALSDDLDKILKGGNLIFNTAGGYAHLDPAIIQAWEGQKASGGEQEGICLVTGKRTQIARLHNNIKGVPGAQSAGAALVSFNAPAFESYGKEQSYNAPVGAYAAYAYTTALNLLLSDRAHTISIGDTIVVYWSADAEPAYQKLFAATVEPREDNQELVSSLFQKLAAGKFIDVDDLQEKLSLEQPFYILGLAPNAARLSVRFFYQNQFGAILRHLKEHYDRLEMIKPAYDPIQYLGVWRMLQETVNKKSKDKKPQPNMAAGVMKAILSGEPYPAALYYSVLNRIRAEQDNQDQYIQKITRGRAAIIKAYLLRNRSGQKEDITVSLNENSRNVAYTLGREFAVLEEIQEAANPGLNSTIKDRYFNAACATPAMIFPTLFKLKNSHIKKLDHNRGTVIHYEKLLGSLQDIITVQESQSTAYPKRLTLEEQGMFILGYYHQTQKRFEKRIQEEK